MKLLEMSDANSFLERCRAHLLSAEAENNLLLSSAWTLARSSATRSPKLSFFICLMGQQVVAAALNAPERRLLISHASDEAAAFMGTELAQRGTRLRGILGPASAASAFSQAMSLEQGQVMEPRFSQRILKLDTPTEHAPAPGILRVAKEKDARLLIHWSHRFVEECGLDENPQETELMVRRYLENRQLYIWEDKKIVAMAGWGGLTPNGVRVNMVYTDPTVRGRGYAGTLVHVLSRKLLNDGHRFCFLFTDAKNPIANRVYERLGYRPVGNFTEYR